MKPADVSRKNMMFFFLFPQVYWICCLLVIASGYFIGLTLSNPTPSPSPSPIPSASPSPGPSASPSPGPGPTPVPSVEPTAESEKSSETTSSDLDLETQDQVAILKQINRVNEDGSYTFGYEAADGSFKIETRDVAGNVRGMFGFINENGELKRVSYSASNGTGFQSSGTLNIPPLPGTPLSGDDDSYKQIPPKIYQQLVRPSKKDEETSTRINLLPTTINYGSSTTSTPRLPIYIYGSSTLKNDVSSTIKPVVIQHIPKVRPTPASSSTEPTESEEITSRPTYGSYLPKKSSTPSYITLKSNEITSTESTTIEEPTRKPNVIQVIRPRTGPYKKVIVTKRPIDTTTPKVVTTTDYYSKDYAARLRDKEIQNEFYNNGVRRQLPYNTNYATGPDYMNLVTSGTEDSPDVYGGGPTSRPYPAAAYRTLFTQIPQHQRILQNSYIQNQNQYLAAALNSGLPLPNINPQLPYPGGPQPIPGGPQQIGPNNFLPPVNPEYQQPGRRLPNPPADPRQYTDQRVTSPAPVPQPAPAPQVPPVAPNQPYPPPYIPPALMEQIIRMLLLAQQRRQPQGISPFQQALISTLGPNNIPPELQDNKGYGYDPRYYQAPYPNYSQVPYPYPPYGTQSNYDPRYADPRLMGPYGDPRAPPYPPPYPYPDPRYGYQQGPYGPNPYGPYQPRLPYGIDPRQQQQNDDSFLLRMLLSARYPPQEPNPEVQNSPNTVERSPVYGQRLADPSAYRQRLSESGAYGQRLSDSTTSPTTLKPRLSSVRNVQILDPVNESTESSSSFVRNIKSKKSEKSE